MSRPSARSIVQRLVRLALQEDLGAGDLSAAATIDEGAAGAAMICAKHAMVIAGMETLEPLWRLVDPAVVVEPRVANGARIGAGDAVAAVRGPVRALLAGERTCLNLLGRLCGVATLTAQFVAAAAGTKARIYDTRKTTPGMRALEKAAVRAGGGCNHRMGLDDQILLKDNHIDACGGMAAALAKARARFPAQVIEVEARTEEEFAAALAGGADIVLLDNMTLDRMRRCVARAAGRVELEASGGVTLARVAELAACGVDRISVGALTHSAPAADLHMKLVFDR